MFLGGFFSRAIEVTFQTHIVDLLLFGLPLGVAEIDILYKLIHVYDWLAPRHACMLHAYVVHGITPLYMSERNRIGPKDNHKRGSVVD